MARDDYNRRRLRGMYERNKQRVSALADARDRRRDGGDDDFAPRRYVVSERRTRIEGFGRGGRQVRRVVRIIERRPRGGSRRFDDRGVFRRGGRDRFVRDDDFDREVRRERFHEEERRRRGKRGGERVRDGEGRRRGDGVARFGVSRRQRLRLREKDRKSEQSRRGGRRGNGGNNNGNNNNNNNNNGGRAEGGRRGGRRGHGGEKSGNRQPQQQQQQKSRGGRGGRQRDGPAPSHADLDHQLDSYRGN